MEGGDTGSYGGAILVNQNGVLAANDCVIAGCSAYSNGGAVEANGLVRMNRCVLLLNTAGSFGGAIHGSVPFTLNDCVIWQNSSFDGGGIYGVGAFNNCTFTGNYASDDGGAIYSTYASSSNLLRNCTIVSNEAVQGGTLAAHYGGRFPMTNTIVAGNFFSGADITGDFSGANNFIGGDPQLGPWEGGETPALPPLWGSPVVDAGADLVTNDLATDGGGGPRLVGAHVDIGAAEYIASPEVTNAADSGPGTLRDAATWTWDGTVIFFDPSMAGQIIHLTSGELLLGQDITVDGSGVPGGVIIDAGKGSRVFEITNGNVTLNNLFVRNGYVIADDGGGIRVDSGSTLTVNESIVSDNSALGADGGGIGAGGGLVLNDCVISNNMALEAGGILIDSGGSLMASNCIITGNSSVGAGGALLNVGVVTLSADTVAGNTAAGYGGAVENDGPLTLVNCVFNGNNGIGGGGAVDNNAWLAAIQCTFFGNAGNPGAVVWAGGDNVFVNCTLVSNIGDVSIRRYGDSTIALTNNIIALNPAGAVADLFTGMNNLTNGDPGLAPLGNYGGPTQTMPPQAGSPALDAGADFVSALLMTDQRGYPRLVGPHVDLGAVEAQAAAAAQLPRLQNAGWTNDASAPVFQFGFSSQPHLDFTVLASTDAATPLTNWTILGHASEISPGIYQFSDLGATNAISGFYTIVSP